MRQLLIAVILGAIAAGAGLVALRRKTAWGTKRVPPALRPGEVDAVLESDRLTKLQWWLFATFFFFAVFLPIYWLLEPGRMASTEEKFKEQSIERGEEYYALATDPQSGEENPVGKECARCHGVNAEGGTNDFLNPDTGQRSIVQVPELTTVFARYQNPPPGYEDGRSFIKETIVRGRPGTDMPTWGVEFGGPLTDQEVEDIINWLESIQKEAEVGAGATGDQIFTQFCATCHGIGGAGGSAPAMRGGSETRQFPDIEEQIRFVSEGSKPGQPYGTSGMGTGGMPGWQGTLTPEQIRMVVEYERSL
ncbi:MAG: cytochrome c [Actinomycetota bacterium]|nr:cytochrome c [Actinomycetota bacterium]